MGKQYKQFYVEGEMKTLKEATMQIKENILCTLKSLLTVQRFYENQIFSNFNSGLWSCIPVFQFDMDWQFLPVKSLESEHTLNSILEEERLKALNLAQVEAIKRHANRKHCKSEDEFKNEALNWIKNNSQRFREKWISAEK